jgi:hypothetical protein
MTMRTNLPIAILPGVVAQLRVPWCSLPCNGLLPFNSINDRDVPQAMTGFGPRYATLKAWAQQLGLQQAVSLLDETLEEEKKTDEALTELAKAAVNQEAQQAAE